MLIGALIMVTGFAAKQWLGAAIGAFLASMGLLGYRSGAGNCYGGSCKPYGSTGDGGCCMAVEDTSGKLEPGTPDTIYDR